MDLACLASPTGHSPAAASVIPLNARPCIIQISPRPPRLRFRTRVPRIIPGRGFGGGDGYWRDAARKSRWIVRSGGNDHGGSWHGTRWKNGGRHANTKVRGPGLHKTSRARVFPVRGHRAEENGGWRSLSRTVKVNVQTQPRFETSHASVRHTSPSGDWRFSEIPE